MNLHGYSCKVWHTISKFYVQDCDLADFFENEKLSEIKPPLPMKKKSDENEEAIDHDKLAYSVSKGFGTSNNYFKSYLIRTIAELFISTGLFVWLIIKGYEPFFGENILEEMKRSQVEFVKQGVAKSKKKIICRYPP